MAIYTVTNKWLCVPKYFVTKRERRIGDIPGYMYLILLYN
jgi:hypothetical protein